MAKNKTPDAIAKRFGTIEDNTSTSGFGITKDTALLIKEELAKAKTIEEENIQVEMARHLRRLTEIGTLIRKASGSFAQAVNFLPTSIRADNIKTKAAKMLRIVISLGTAANVQVSFDNGTTWHNLNPEGASSGNLAADGLYIFDIPIDESDLVNFRHNTAATIVLNRFMLYEMVMTS